MPGAARVRLLLSRRFLRERQKLTWRKVMQLTMEKAQQVGVSAV